MILHSWTLGTKFKNKEKNNTLPGKTKVYILGEEFLRMDVYDPFGLMSVGKLILNKGNMSLETLNGVSYKGPATKEKIKALLKVEVSPKDLFSLFSQSGFKGQRWSCAMADNSNKFQSCKSDYFGISILWSGSMTQRGTELLLQHRKADLKFKVKAYKQLSETNERIFEL